MNNLLYVEKNGKTRGFGPKKEDTKSIFYDSEYFKCSRNAIPIGRSVIGTMITVVSKLAYADGYINYAGYYNFVKTGEWSGGIKGFYKYLKGFGRDKKEIVKFLKMLRYLGVITYYYDTKTKVFNIRLVDGSPFKEIFIKNAANKVRKVHEYPHPNGNAERDYAFSPKNAPAPTSKNGFILLPKDLALYIPEGYRFTKFDAMWDIISSLSFNDPYIKDSDKMPIFTPRDRDGNVLYSVSLAFLAKRWGWGRTSVHRFFDEFSDFFKIENLGQNKGSLVTANDALIFSGLLDKDYYSSKRAKCSAAIEVPEEKKKEYYTEKHEYPSFVLTEKLFKNSSIKAHPATIMRFAGQVISLITDLPRELIDFTKFVTSEDPNVPLDTSSIKKGDILYVQTEDGKYKLFLDG